jgi:hypothetical protein
MVGPAVGCMAASYQDSCDSVRGWMVVGNHQVERWEGVGHRVDDPRMSVAAVHACQRNTWPQLIIS